MTPIIYIASLIAAGALIAALAFQFGARATMAAIDAGARWVGPDETAQ